MQNAAHLHPASPPPVLALRGAGLTDGAAALVVHPVRPGPGLDAVVSAVSAIRGVRCVSVNRHDGDTARLQVTTARPVALASELRVALRHSLAACTWAGGSFGIRLAGAAPATQATDAPRFDHRVASDFDRALGFDVYARQPVHAVRGREPAPRHPPARPALNRAAGRAPGRLALGAGRGPPPTAAATAIAFLRLGARSHRCPRPSCTPSRSGPSSRSSSSTTSSPLVGLSTTGRSRPSWHPP